MFAESATPEDVLSYYGITFRRMERELSFMCPFHADKSRSASMNVHSGLWMCHSCGVRGNVFQFIARQENCTPDEAQEAALKPTFLNIDLSDDIEEIEDRVSTSEHLVPLTVRARAYLDSRGFSIRPFFQFSATVDLVTDRLILPVQDRYGKASGFVGRALAYKVQPKYLFTKGLQKKNFLFGHQQALKLCSRSRRSKVLIVEGPLDAIKAYYFGYPAVALMGCMISEAQISLLAADFDYIYVAADVDCAGREMENQIIVQLEPIFGPKLLLLPLPKKDVGDCTREEFRSALRCAYSPLCFDIDTLLKPKE